MTTRSDIVLLRAVGKGGQDGASLAGEDAQREAASDPSGFGA